LGFTNVYHEGFETVLFLQALVLESGTGMVLTGVEIGFLATILVGIIAFKLQTRLPYMNMLIVTGILICGVLLVMVGKTVHVLQVVGWMPTTLINGISFPYYWISLLDGDMVWRLSYMAGSYFPTARRCFCSWEWRWCMKG